MFLSGESVRYYSANYIELFERKLLDFNSWKINSTLIFFNENVEQYI